MADLLVTNFNRNFTGVSATAANVIRQQARRYDMALVGRALPGCPDPISIAAARAASRHHDPAKPFAIWHVRRNTEMRAAIWARDILRLPVRIVFTSAAQRRHSAFPRWLISRMDAVVATTDAAATYVPHVRAVVPHGVDTDVFTPAENRTSAWAALGYGGQQGIATIGRIRPEKGTDLFVDAMLRLLPDHPGTVALVIGRAAREHQGFLKGLQARITAAGLGERILFPGEISASDLPRVMRALSLVMQLPRYEGYGMAPLEGLASAVPFVGSDTGYYGAFSAQGTVGTVVPLEAADAAAQAAGQLLSSPKELSRRGQAGRDLAVHAFSAGAEADGIDAVYQQLWSAG
ncbi:glycosyltransferase family 4 protein [Phaeobacter sp. HS012]|uniref:glycosyltransferase family 4 protein n=1 Tax=unclassified Phaeobacter TaxID=2621772 RepID=UPI001B387C65|nr:MULTISPECIES: glycosyltransferase family 4 protein [unclassified Phaeobacter]MBQ4806358.1 glycosyltransferase family 4 protein [Phaeobacter sp. HS012]MBQ4881208.1 glycosyltransferase family 4 protein [Phaeobacter sp. HS011]